MTLNGVMAVISRYITEIWTFDFEASYVTLVEIRPMPFATEM